MPVLLVCVLVLVRVSVTITVFVIDVPSVSPHVVSVFPACL